MTKTPDAKMYKLVEETLESLGFKDEYLQLFFDNEVNDSDLQDCISDSVMANSLVEFIGQTGRRVKFLKKFRENLANKGTSEEPQLTCSVDELGRHLSNVQLTSPSIQGVINTVPSARIASEDFMQKTSVPSGQPISFRKMSWDEAKSPLETVTKSDIDLNASPDVCNTNGNETSASPTPQIHAPQPVQIMNFRECTENPDELGIEFYQPSLEKIIEKTGSRPIAVLAIAGPTRKGKSFFLNYVLRYLRGKVEDDFDWMGWARSKDPLVGFPWRTSSDRITTGIWMWSEPITRKSKSGQEYDILLMDTQGVFDEHTSPQQWSVLVGLGLLSSSCLIFNISSDLQEDQLNIFDTFLKFGLMTLETQSNGSSSTGIEPPFQKLIFLLRDWSNTQQHPYGSVGGKGFIQKKLEIKPHHREAHKRIRAQLTQCFDDVTAFLLPNPGPAAFELDYNGATSQCTVFLSEMEKCIEEIMDPEEFPLNKLNGNYLTGKDYLAHFTLCCDLLSREEIPSSESFYSVAIRSCHSVVINKCVAIVTEEIEKLVTSHPYLPSSLLAESEENIKEKALETFASSKKLGSPESVEQSKQTLLDKIKVIFDSLRVDNDRRKVKIISDALRDATVKYVSHMESKLSNDFYSPDALEVISSDAEGAAMTCFNDFCPGEDSDNLSEEREKLTTNMRQKLVIFQHSNAVKRFEAERKLEVEVEKLASEYKSEMEFKTDGTIVSEEELIKLHDLVWHKCIRSFEALKPHFLLLKGSQENLKAKVGAIFESITRSVKTCNENIRMVGEQLKASVLRDYSLRMRASMGIPEPSFRGLHCKIKEEVSFGLANTDRIKSKKCINIFLQELESETEEMYGVLLKELGELLKELRNKRQLAKVEALNKYLDSMNKLFQDAAQSPIVREKLHSRHLYAESVAHEQLAKFFDNLPFNHRNEVEEKIFSDVLHDDINEKYDTFEANNQLRWSKFESEARNTLSKVKEEYVSLLNSALEESLDEDEFYERGENIKKQCESGLLKRIDTNLAKPEFLESLEQELSDYGRERFIGSLEVFTMKQAEDKVQVDAAFQEAKKYYNDEMDKLMKEQDWYPPEVLERKSEEKVDFAIESCMDEVDLTDAQEHQLRKQMKTLFVKYCNENLKRYPRDSFAVGIDLGTTYSCVAVYINKQVKVIECEGKATIPSVVAFNDSHGVDVGEAARSQFYRHPENTIFDAKRLIGRKFSDEIVQEDTKLWPFNVIGDKDDQPKILVRGVELRPEEISARILAKLKNVAEEYLLKPVLEAVVTVPAYFNDAQRQ